MKNIGGESRIPASLYRDEAVGCMYQHQDILDEDLVAEPPLFIPQRSGISKNTMTSFKPLRKSDFETGEVAPPSKKREAPSYPKAHIKITTMLAVQEVHDCDRATMYLLRSLEIDC